MKDLAPFNLEEGAFRDRSGDITNREEFCIVFPFDFSWRSDEVFVCEVFSLCEVNVVVSGKA